MEQYEAESIISKILFPILITSKETRKIVYANPYAQKQYETTLDALVGMEVAELYTDESQREKILSNIKADGTVENLEMNFKTLKNNRFIGLLSVTNIMFRDEECFMGMVKDITLQKEQEKQLARQSKMQALGELISNVAHQWRQPLNAISVLASGTLVEKELGVLNDQALIANLQQIGEQSQYLSNTINSFRKLIFNSTHEIEHLFNLHSTIQNLLDLSHYSFTVIKKFHQNEIEIFGMPNQLTQVLSNILQNSADAFKRIQKPKKDSFVIISTKSDKNYIVIEIIDNANGIDEQIIDKIFEPYFTTEHKSQGKGLGLFNAHNKIVDTLQGTINCQNHKYVIDSKEQLGLRTIIKLPTKKGNKK